MRWGAANFVAAARRDYDKFRKLAADGHLQNGWTIDPEPWEEPGWPVGPAARGPARQPGVRAAADRGGARHQPAAPLPGAEPGGPAPPPLAHGAGAGGRGPGQPPARPPAALLNGARGRGGTASPLS